MLEIELKYPCDDWSALEVTFQEWGATWVGDRVDVDQYFNGIDRDFAQTDEAFRVRQIGDETYLTYKGPKRDLQTKTRKEIEIPVEPGLANADRLKELVRALGFRPVAVVSKNRRVYQMVYQSWDITVCLDAVQDVGQFIELEIVAPEDQYEPARDVLLACAKELGFGESERRSYISLLLAKQAKTVN